jgi:hypothetical protein
MASAVLSVTLARVKGISDVAHAEGKPALAASFFILNVCYWHKADVPDGGKHFRS